MLLRSHLRQITTSAWHRPQLNCRALVSDVQDVTARFRRHTENLDTALASGSYPTLDGPPSWRMGISKARTAILAFFFGWLTGYPSLRGTGRGHQLSGGFGSAAGSDGVSTRRQISAVLDRRRQECHELGRAELISECEPGLACWIGTCRKYCDVFQEGDNCDDDFLGDVCPEDMTCIHAETSGSCRIPDGEGDFCDGDGNLCAPGLYCNSSLQMCVPPSEIGEPCPPGASCVRDAYCSAGVCVEEKQPGEACVDTTECASKDCVANVCAEFPDQPGESCFPSSECAEGLECDFETLACVLIEPATCKMASSDCAVEFNGTCDEQASGGACETDVDPYDCGYCPDSLLSDGWCSEGLGSCPTGTDPDC
jgi:hypothetical protein